MTKRQSLRENKQTLVITNGCFDLLHAGHLYFLNHAARLGDTLWVLLNSDSSVHSLKGPSRPVQSEQERAYALASLEAVQSVIIFYQKRLTKEIRLLQPDIYVKAGDYSLATLDKEELVAFKTVNSTIRFLPFLEGFSTTSFLDKIRCATLAKRRKSVDTNNLSNV